jgi:hypothetical protein
MRFNASCDLKGGLGNQIFQIFATISYAFDHDINFSFMWNNKSNGGRSTYWINFFVHLQPYLVASLPLSIRYIEPCFSYRQLPQSHANMVFDGYFQSEKYFKNHYDKICDLIRLEDMKQVVKEKAVSLCLPLENTVSIHFRRGDYKNLTHFHPLMDQSFYLPALSAVSNKVKNVLYFCEEEDVIDVNKMVVDLQHIFSELSFTLCPVTLCDWEQLLLMSLCTHNIIANSSFSWWGAYFNSNPDKIIVRPSLWFNSKDMDTSDLCPPSWIVR